MNLKRVFSLTALRDALLPKLISGEIRVDNGRGTARRAPTTHERFGKPVAGSLPTIMRSFKSATTKRINEIRKTPGAPVWQRNYFEHIIRNEDELDRIRRYIADNPPQWETDRDHADDDRPWEMGS